MGINTKAKRPTEGWDIMGRITTTRMLGCADYKAQWIDDSMAVRLTARGFLACRNHFAQLEKRADGGWELVFIAQDCAEESYIPFCTEAIVVASADDETVSVRDALGQYDIAIQPAEAAVPEDAGEHIVYARNTAVNVPDETYFTQPVGTKVLPIYARAFGPASKSACAAFIASANADFMVELDQLHAKIERAEGGEE